MFLSLKKKYFKLLSRNWILLFRETGEILKGSGGMVHMEKNWGESFPESWIWTQGVAAHPEKVQGLSGALRDDRVNSTEPMLTHLLLYGAFVN